MRVEGIREFRRRAPALLKGGEMVYITRHGRLSGLMIPLDRPEELPVELRRELLERIGAAVQRQLGRLGIREQDVLRDFERWRRRRRAAARRR